jgi:hypothetical protein
VLPLLEGLSLFRLIDLGFWAEMPLSAFLIMSCNLFCFSASDAYILVGVCERGLAACASLMDVAAVLIIDVLLFSMDILVLLL